MRVGHLCQFDHEFYDNHVYDSFGDIFDVEFDEDDDRWVQVMNVADSVNVDDDDDHYDCLNDGDTSVVYHLCQCWWW